MAKLLARINDQYWSDVNRGYAIGYNWGCAYHNGDLWNIRDHDIRCGANGCQLVNVPYVAILVPTPNIGAQPSAAQDNALKNQWVPELKAFYPNIEVHVLGHRDVRGRCSDGGGTACPGEPIYSKIRANFYDKPGGTPPTPIPTGDDEVATLIRSTDGTAAMQATVFAWSGSVITQFSNDPDMRSIGVTAGVLKVNGADTQYYAFRRPASEIQTLINLCWAGPRGQNAGNLNGYVIPADPSVDPAIKARDNAANTLISVGPDLKAAVGKIPTTSTPGSGNGATVGEIEDVLGRSTVQVESVPGNAPIVVNEA
jgi:hypothetical protein